MAQRSLIAVVITFLVSSFSLPGFAVAKGKKNSGTTVLHTVYISTGDGGQILRVDELSNGKAAVSAIYTDTTYFAAADIVVGPDGLVYAGNSPMDEIIRIEPDGSNFETISSVAVTDPNGLSFLGFDLYFSTPSRVWRIAGVGAVDFGDGGVSAPESVLTHSGGIANGTAFALTGELLIVDGDSGEGNGKVLSAVPDPDDDPPYSSTTDGISGLTNPVGIAVAAPSNDILVSSGGEILICDEGSCSSFVSFDAPDIPLYFENDLVGNLFIVTAEDATGAGGKVWRVDADGDNLTLIVELAKVKGKNKPETDQAIGLALPATTRATTKTYTSGSSQTETFKCGSSIMEITMTTDCDLTITCRELRPADINTDLEAGLGVGAGDVQCVQYDWNGGYCVEYEATGCEGAPAVETYFAYLKFKDFPDQTAFPAVLKINGADVEDVTSSYYTTGSFLPEDFGRGSQFGGFSSFVLADLVLQNENAVFGGFQPQISGNPGAPTPVAEGSTFPVRFSLSGELIENPEALLSVARIDPFERIEVVSAGDSNELNQFRCSDGLCVYNLKTTGYATGLYSVVVISNSFAVKEVFIEIN